MTMWKKNPTAADCKQFMYNETEWPGKKPKAPKTLKGCLADLIKDSTSWLRKCPDVWFQRHEKALWWRTGSCKIRRRDYRVV